VANSQSVQTSAKLDLDALREKLVQHRNQIMDLYRQDLRAGKEAADEGSDDIVDRANNSYNREFMFLLSDSERQTLHLVERALARMEKGNYGACRNCGREIGPPRLQAVPWARYCIDCQELAEQGLLEEEED
jgi:DnaK suppressor protein